MVWLSFILSSSILVVAAIKLAQYGDIIAVRTKLSGMFIGTLLLAGATSLPELLSALNALSIGVPDLAAGSMFGSTMFNMFLLALLDLLNQQTRILRRVAVNHALTAGLVNLLIGLVIFFLLSNIDFQLGWVGADSLLIIGVYIGGVRLIQIQGGAPPSEVDVEVEDGVPSLIHALIGFGAATLVLVFITPILVQSSNQIAEITGLTQGFVGVILLGIVTSLPELVATIAAVRIHAYDLAVGNLFGSNLFNMFALGLTDVLFLGGRFLGLIDPAFALAGLLGLILTSLALVGNIARVERRLLFVEIDALLILITYFLGLYFLYVRGIGA